MTLAILAITKEQAADLNIHEWQRTKLVERQVLREVEGQPGVYCGPFDPNSDEPLEPRLYGWFGFGEDGKSGA